MICKMCLGETPVEILPWSGAVHVYVCPCCDARYSPENQQWHEHGMGCGRDGRELLCGSSVRE
jgi:hypothetical protein